jgi:transcriptional regulator with XRE-family HTH domain
MRQTALAERLGVTQALVSQWVRGNRMPSVEVLQRIASVFGISLDKLMEGEVGRTEIAAARMAVLREEGIGYDATDLDREAFKLLRSLRRRYLNRIGDRRQIELALEMLFGMKRRSWSNGWAPNLERRS